MPKIFKTTFEFFDAILFSFIDSAWKQYALFLAFFGFSAAAAIPIY